MINEIPQEISEINRNRHRQGKTIFITTRCDLKNEQENVGQVKLSG